MLHCAGSLQWKWKTARYFGLPFVVTAAVVVLVVVLVAIPLGFLGDGTNSKLRSLDFGFIMLLFFYAFKRNFWVFLNGTVVRMCTYYPPWHTQSRIVIFNLFLFILLIKKTEFDIYHTYTLAQYLQNIRLFNMQCFFFFKSYCSLFCVLSQCEQFTVFFYRYFQSFLFIPYEHTNTHAFRISNKMNGN